MKAEPIMKKRNRIIITLLWIGAILANVKAIFTDFGPDQTYAIATSYRHLLGDRMFEQMWEPHQTSSFLSDLGMWIYHAIVPSYEGVALFMQLFGVLFYAIVTFFLFKSLRRHYELEISHLICILFFTLRAKLMVYPEFSNMHICFSVLLFLCLWEFLENQKRYRLLIFAAVCMCLQILSYPSCLITFVGVVVCLSIFSENRKKSLGVFIGVCALIGLSYTTYFVLRVGMDSFLWNISHIFTSDKSHTATTFSFMVFFKGTLIGIVWVAVVAAIAYLIYRLKKWNFYICFMVMFLISDIVILFVSQSRGVDFTTPFFIINPCIMGLAAWRIRKMVSGVRKMWIISMIISFCSLVSVLLLTNQEFLSVFAYMILGTIMSLIPLSRRMETSSEKKTDFPWAIALLVLFFIVHRILSVYGYLNVDGEYLITGVENVVRVGPTKGIVTTLSECNEARYGIEDWKTYTQSGETVLMVEQSWYDPIVYMYNQNIIAAYSTIDTPVYDESLELYWSKYEEKRPTIIAVKSWEGVEDLDQNGWMADYLEQNYTLIEIGVYWNFYRIK